jgi:hypothetical protein
VHACCSCSEPHRSLDVVEQLLFLARVHEAEQVTRLTVVIVAVAMTVAIRGSGDLQRRLLHSTVLPRPTERVRFVINLYMSHRRIAMIATIATAAIPYTQYGQIVSRPSHALPFQ